MKTGRVFLVGAGPGDPALLTEQGRKCLEQADAVVYDALACSSVLNLTKPDCSLIFAGKMAGNHYKKQSETNRLLVESRWCVSKAAIRSSLDVAEKRRRYCRKTAFRFPLCRVCPPATVYRHMPASL